MICQLGISTCDVLRDDRIVASQGSANVPDAQFEIEPPKLAGDGARLASAHSHRLAGGLCRCREGKEFSPVSLLVKQRLDRADYQIETNQTTFARIR